VPPPPDPGAQPATMAEAEVTNVLSIPTVAKDSDALILPPAPRVPDGVADAELIRLCDTYIANHRAYESSTDERDSDDHPLWPEYIRSFHAMEDHPPAQTMAGVLALARVAKVEAMMKGREVWEGTAAIEWAVDAINDLLRLHGEPVA
jgi:hypothetical protein